MRIKTTFLSKTIFHGPMIILIINAESDAIYIRRLWPNFLAENKGKNLGKSTQPNFNSFDGHFVNLEKGLAPSGFKFDMSVNGWACS